MFGIFTLQKLKLVCCLGGGGCLGIALNLLKYTRFIRSTPALPSWNMPFRILCLLKGLFFVFANFFVTFFLKEFKKVLLFCPWYSWYLSSATKHWTRDQRLGKSYEDPPDPLFTFGDAKMTELDDAWCLMARIYR